MEKYILTHSTTLDDMKYYGGGKAYNLLQMKQNKTPVPNFIVVSSSALQYFLEENSIEINVHASDNICDKAKKIQESILEGVLSSEFQKSLTQSLEDFELNDTPVAVRSSGLDEDSKEHSFAGMFESFLFQKDIQDILYSIKQCWASAFSERCLEYRLKNNLTTSQISMGVVIQKMINSESSGVLFTRNPIEIIDRKNVIVESLFGQCEGLVSGELDSDNFKVNRDDYEIEKKINKKEDFYTHNTEGSGLIKMKVETNLQEAASLTDQDLIKLVQLSVELEKTFSMPLDIEWAIEKNNLYILQMRPITTTPTLAYYDESINGGEATLWDNSNIVESFAGVTTPLTFSLTKEAYDIVYRQTCRVIGVPEHIIEQYDYSYKNMLGFIRGRVYYNLINWYKLLFLIPGSANNQGFMETMMGVKEDLNQEQQKLFNFIDQIPKYSIVKRMSVLVSLIIKFINIDKIVKKFNMNFNKIYLEYLDIDFKSKSLRELRELYMRWEQNITYKWNAPIINDFLVMVFFGTLKKLTEKWIKSENTNLQNDLLCGQGEVESTMPTLTLMKLASKYDHDEKLSDLFRNRTTEELISLYQSKENETITQDIDLYLRNYGFRCNNEQKLEEEDLYTNPSFIFNAIKNYIKLKNYDIEKMQRNEQEILKKAEDIVHLNLKGLKKKIFYWVLKHARNAVKNRENLRFLRSKSFGISRRLFQAIGHHLAKLDVISTPQDVFYLTFREIFEFIEGKADYLNLKEIAQIRKNEFETYRQESDPPDRFITFGAIGTSLNNTHIISSGDLLRNKIKVSDDPNLIYGVSCCPGVISGKALVAKTIDDASDLNGEILITKRTDPGWVPLFPSCSGLIVERGSLLSHSAVIARELGIPTIVGVSSDLLSKVETGDHIELNATNGEIRLNI
jgi:phosphohistidine swiveling domain-containing protein